MTYRCVFLVACISHLIGCSYVDVSETPEYLSYIGKDVPASKNYWIFCTRDSKENATITLPKESPWGTCLLSEIYPGAESSKWHPRAMVKRGTPIRVLFVTASAGLGGAPGAHRAFGEVKISPDKKVKVLRHRSEGEYPLW